MRKINKKVAAVAIGAVAFTGTGVAYAFWTTTGGGTGAATTAAGDVDALTVTGDVLDAMFPGDVAQTVTATVTNTGAANAYVSSVKAYLTVVAPGCEADDYLIDGEPAGDSPGTAQELAWTAVDLAKSGGMQGTTYTIQFNNAATENQDGCKGAKVTINYLAS